MWSWPLWFGLGWIQEVKRGRAKQQWRRDHWEDKFGVNGSWFCDEIKVSLSHQDTPLKHIQTGYFFLSFEPYSTVVTRRHLHSWQLNFFYIWGLDVQKFQLPKVHLSKVQLLNKVQLASELLPTWITVRQLNCWTFRHLNFSCPKVQLSRVQLSRVQMSRVKLSRVQMSSCL